MRSNKFRAWDKKNKKMVYYSPLTMLIDGLERDEYWVKNYKRFPFDYIEMGSAGIYDKNGDEIFEGDVLDIPFPEFMPAAIRAATREEIKLKQGHPFCVVEWASGGTGGYTGHGLGFHNDGEIIGNIHENPELLTPTK